MTNKNEEVANTKTKFLVFQNWNLQFNEQFILKR